MTVHKWYCPPLREAKRHIKPQEIQNKMQNHKSELWASLLIAGALDEMAFKGHFQPISMIL